MGRTLRRYIMREIAAPFFLGLCLFTFVLLTMRILKLVELVVNRGVPLGQTLRLFLYILPGFLELTVPMALLLAVLLAFGRLSTEGEIVALRTSGISLYQLLVPVGLCSVIVAAATLILSLYARPWGNTALKSALYDIAKVRATAGLREQVFSDDFANLVIYARQIEPPGNVLRGVLISDRRDPAQQTTVFARSGLVVQDERSQVVTLQLRNGSIHGVTPGHGYQKTDFALYEINLQVDGAWASSATAEKRPKEMTLPELARTIGAKGVTGDPAYAERVEWHRRFSIPCACLVFGLLALPLGLQPVRTVRSHGLTMSLGVILLYYLLLTMAEALGHRGLVPPGIALWTPNALFAAAASVLFVRADQERRFRLAVTLEGRFSELRARWVRLSTPEA